MNNPPFQLALVTGATSGIGEALARLFASLGINLILHGRNGEKLDFLKKELEEQVKVTSIQADLSEVEERNLLLDLLRKMAPDLVINNAGAGLYGDILSHNTSDSSQLLDLNCSALLEITIEAARTLSSLGKKGVILNVSSTAAWPVFPGMAVYSATKAFVNQFSESFDAEVKPLGIRILSSCPGVVDTNFRKNAGGSDRKTSMEKANKMTAESAASEIWGQILKRKGLYLFNWPYRFLIFLVKYLLPKSLVASVLRKTVKQIQ